MNNQPMRVQLSRKKGFRLPPNTVVVSRPSKWGNPFISKDPNDRARTVELFSEYYQRPEQAKFVEDVRIHLRGKNLACWCPLDKACHADILLQLVNVNDQPNK